MLTTADTVFIGAVLNKLNVLRITYQVECWFLSCLKILHSSSCRCGCEVGKQTFVTSLGQALYLAVSGKQVDFVTGFSMFSTIVGLILSL